MKKKADEIIAKIESKDCLPLEDLKFLPESSKEIEKLTCPICYSLILNPVSCKCDPYHLYGRNCLHESLKTKNECPLSRQKLEPKYVNTPPFEIISKLNKLKVQCEFCEWDGTLGGLKYHLKDCGGIIIECPFYGSFCQEQKIAKKDLKKHLRENLKTHVSAAKNIFSIDKLVDLFDVIEEKL